MNIRKTLLFLILVLLLILTACSIPFLGDSGDGNLDETVAAQEETIAAMEREQEEIFAGQTATAMILDAIDEALTATAEAQPPATDTMVPSDTPIPTDTPIPFTDTPEFTATASETVTPIPTNTIKASPTQCYYVLDNWCFSHEGCHKMTIINKTNSTATIRIWLYDGTVDSTIYSPPGIRCTMEMRPGKYNYSFDYCGQHSDGAHALNGNWYINFECP